ncbi:hypothetical protein RchiOBHm_Chr3g0453881 [Rosa chinensis]|uniref:Uncharacterized protein n=1 Tax=Rosa chinensis TaxID=74649 RepID=A0A2P6R6N2_ROSCH|nr:hypothetical protein RchiOBHm_Chr3g0453881 [Rosa chinensis]
MNGIINLDWVLIAGLCWYEFVISVCGDCFYACNGVDCFRRKGSLGYYQISVVPKRNIVHADYDCIYYQ